MKEDRKQSVYYRVGEKDPVTQVVSIAGGYFCKAATSFTIMNIVDNLAKPEGLKEKILVGVGSYLIGSRVGDVIADEIEIDLMQFGGLCVLAKASFEEALKGRKVDFKVQF